jgi:hypothetical protein
MKAGGAKKGQARACAENYYNKYKQACMFYLMD